MISDSSYSEPDIKFLQTSSLIIRVKIKLKFFINYKSLTPNE